MRRSITDKEFYIMPTKEESDVYKYYHNERDRLEDKLLKSGVMKEGDILYKAPFSRDFRILRKENIMCAESFNEYLIRKEKENENNK